MVARDREAGPCFGEAADSNIPEGDRFAVAAHDQLAALILHGYVTAMAHGGPYIEDRLDFLPVVRFGAARRAAGVGVVLALGSKHRSIPAAGRRRACREPVAVARCMPPGGHLVKMVSKFKGARGVAAMG
jgi:hypothetical protein